MDKRSQPTVEELVMGTGHCWWTGQVLGAPNWPLAPTMRMGVMLLAAPPQTKMEEDVGGAVPHEAPVSGRKKGPPAHEMFLQQYGMPLPEEYFPNAGKSDKEMQQLKWREVKQDPHIKGKRRKREMHKRKCVRKVKKLLLVPTP